MIETPSLRAQNSPRPRNDDANVRHKSNACPQREGPCKSWGCESHIWCIVIAVYLWLWFPHAMSSPSHDLLYVQTVVQTRPPECTQGQVQGIELLFSTHKLSHLHCRRYPAGLSLRACQARGDAQSPPSPFSQHHHQRSHNRRHPHSPAGTSITSTGVTRTRRRNKTCRWTWTCPLACLASARASPPPLPPSLPPSHSICLHPHIPLRQHRAEHIDDERKRRQKRRQKMKNEAVATELELLRGIFYNDGLIIEEKRQEQQEQDGNENENEEVSSS